ncbi:GNAT family N-acetyltransferase [Bradyrhizobium iriomotense]|uniref:N-acetyltransferase domain-containing protein n=1 Tax=Bradyrhizobium iriomotense TaxID=441950 RepID=A0ABQ6B699_9BRAD|nr:GNAT family N-acetyltransferase [Bradyrhizobium iriomotense]GLR88146.1 hypothetical protein GCM10007857_48580 [Bradyrhizobium iriomotense]
MRLSQRQMQFVPCTEDYWEFVRDLRTGPETGKWFLQQAQITSQQQRTYMKLHWRNYFIAILEARPVGFVGSIDNDIRVCVHPDHWRRGIGRFLITELMQRFPHASARVKERNEAGNALFRSTGFVRGSTTSSRTDTGDHVPTAVWTLPDPALREA